MKKLLTACLTVFGLGASADDPPMNLDQLLEAFGWNLDAIQIVIEEVDDGLYVLFGAGGNIGVSIGEQGVLVVDDMFPELIPKVNEAIAHLGGGPVDFAINTHWHFDHAEGNLALGPAGTWIVAQENSTQAMNEDRIINLVNMKYAQNAYPESAKPVISYDDRMRFYFNGGAIELLHFGPAHTDGDTAVIFREHNAVHMGDVFNNAGYPFVDVDSGGGIDGMIEFCQGVLDEIGPNGIVIPGHGPVTNAQALADYIDMLKTVRGRVAKLIDEGMTLEQAVAAKPTAGLDERYGPEEASLGFVNRVYTSLTKDD